MKLKPEEIGTFSRLLDEGLSLSADQRGDWLARLDPAMAHLTPLLRVALEQSDDTSLQTSAVALPSVYAGVTEVHAGDHIGPYLLKRELGRGGMGAVWLASRADGTIRRDVAIKLPMMTWGAGLAERLARERDIVARLEHPQIARLYDAGVDDLGRPFLALEYIDGQPIDQWCQKHAPPLRRLLALFVEVVRAVAYAHARLVIHRDLKPSNILVTADGKPHLLDFGIAKLLGSDAAEGDNDQLTREHGRALSIAYASPEQVHGRDVTVTSDIYSLGMLLHELLTGVRPPPPRQAPSAETAELPLASTHAPTPLRRRELRGELDAIIAMALRVDPSRRYATADALASDIERHLAGDTVTARPDSLAYRLKKAIRRHWVGVAASASVVVAVVVGTSVAWWQSKIALEAVERERIVRSFVTDVFKVNQQEFGSGAGATVRGAKGSDLLEQSAKLVQAKFTDQPQVQAELYGVVGALFFDMGANRLAGDYLQRQLQALAKTKASPSAVAAVHMQTSSLQLREGQAAEAVAAARRALDLSGNTSSQSIDARVLLMRSLIASSDSNEVLAVLEALERDIQGKDGAAERRALAWTRAIKAQRLANANRRDEAPAVFDEAIAMAEAAEGVDAESPLAMRLMAAQVLVTTGQVDRTQAYFDGAMKTLRARGGNHLVRAAFEAARFAARRHVAVQQISYQAALAQFAESRAQLAATNQVLPDEITSQLDFNEATIHMRHGETNKADALFARSLSVVYAAATTPSERFRVALPYVMHVVNVGDPAAALWTDRRVQHRIESGLGHHPYAAFDHVYKARALARAGRLDDALRALDAAPTFEPIRGEGTRNIHVYTDALALERAEILALMGHTTAARAAFPLRQLIPPGEPMESAGFVAIATLALIDCAAGRSEHGMRAWESVLAHMRTQDQSPHAPDSILTRARAGLCAVQAGQRWQATALAREARASLAAHNRISPFILEQVQKLERALSGGATRPGPAT